MRVVYGASVPSKDGLHILNHRLKIVHGIGGGGNTQIAQLEPPLRANFTCSTMTGTKKHAMLIEYALHHGLESIRMSCVPVLLAKSVY